MKLHELKTIEPWVEDTIKSCNFDWQCPIHSELVKQAIREIDTNYDIDFEIKCVDPWFTEVYNSEKDFEIRKADRPYEVGKIVKMRHYNPEDGSYSGRYVIVKISYLLPEGKFEGLATGYCAMGIKVLVRKER